MLPNATGIEIGWSTTSFVGVCLALLFLWRVVGDERRRRRSGVNGQVRLEVQGDIVLALCLTAVEAMFLLAGAVQMSLPSRPDAAWDRTTALAVLAVLSSFICANLVVVGLITDRLVRRRARNLEIANRPHAVPGGRRNYDPRPGGS